MLYIRRQLRIGDVRIYSLHDVYIAWRRDYQTEINGQIEGFPR